MVEMGPSISLRTLIDVAVARRWPVPEVVTSEPFTSTTMPRRKSVREKAAPASPTTWADASS